MFGASYTINATPVVLSNTIEEGKVVYTGDGTPGGVLTIYVGTYISPLKQEGRNARQLVRNGLADVLDWLGEPVRLRTVAETLQDQLRAGQALKASSRRPAEMVDTPPRWLSR